MGAGTNGVDVFSKEAAINEGVGADPLSVMKSKMKVATSGK